MSDRDTGPIGYVTCVACQSPYALERSADAAQQPLHPRFRTRCPYCGFVSDLARGDVSFKTLPTASESGPRSRA